MLQYSYMDETDGAAYAAKQLSLQQKARIVTGKDFWTSQDYPEIGIPSVRFSDGPNGLRMQRDSADNFGIGKSLPATCFPCACAVASSWDRQLARALGKRLGEEAAYFGADVLLGPGVNIKRNPLCGRNFEYFSEDPYLAGEVAAQYILGVQGTGTGACVKHFAANNREWARTVCDSRMGERTLREIYLYPFEIAVKKGGVRYVMTAYNKLNGTYCSENERLISGILRGEWNFGGAVVSDWTGTADRVAGIKAGEDLEMPRCAFTPEEVLAAVEDGSLSREQLDACVRRIVRAAMYPKAERKEYDLEEHLRLARELAENCAVLLKNEGVLPLEGKERVAVIGDLARDMHVQGGGSAHVNCARRDDFLQELSKLAHICGFERGYRRDGKGDKKLAERAVKLAKSADKTVLFLGLSEIYDAEGGDRPGINLPANQLNLLHRLAARGVRPVVVLCAGSAVDTSWDNMCSAVLCLHLAGEGAAYAAARLLCGQANPCGKLAESYPADYKDVPCHRGFAANALSAEYAEDIFVGYRWYDAAEISPKYPFGHGLSYTQFCYSQLAVSPAGVRFKVKNIGGVAGAEVAQLYISPPDCGFAFPRKRLAGFEKVFLQPLEEREIFIPFEDTTFRAFNGKWRIYAGRYGILIGSSSRDIRLEAQINLKGEVPPAPGTGVAERRKIIAAARDFSPAPDLPQKGRAEITMYSPMIDLKRAKGLAGRLIYRLATAIVRRKGHTALHTFRYITVRGVAQYAGFNLAQAHGFVQICNGRFLRGLAAIIKKKSKKEKSI